MNDLLLFLIIGDKNNNILDGKKFECNICEDYVLHYEACAYLQNFLLQDYNYKISSDRVNSGIRDRVVDFCCDVAKNNNIMFLNVSEQNSKYGILTLPEVLTKNEYEKLKEYEDKLKDYYLDIKIFDNNSEICNNGIYNRDNKLIGFVNPFKVDDYYNNYKLKDYSNSKIKKLNMKNN